MCIVDEAVENGVGDGGIGDDLVPVIDGTWLVMMVEPR